MRAGGEFGALVAGVAWQVLQAAGGFLVGHYPRHTSEVFGVFAIVLGLLFGYMGAQLSLHAAEVNVVASPRLWPRSLLQPPLANADQPPQLTLPTNSKADLRRPPGSTAPPASTPRRRM